ncbi:MAG: hypothetical protein ABIW79_10695, partial [Gemmatimonas sp.]
MSNRRILPGRVLVALVLTLAATSPLSAQRSPGGMQSQKPIRLVVSGGLTVPAGDLKDLHDSGFHYDGSVIFNLPGLPFAIRPELSLTTLKLKSPLVQNPFPTGAYSADGDQTKLLAAIGNIEVPLAGGLYLIGGVGAMNLKTTLAGATSDSSATNLLIDAGAGFRFHISRIDGFVEGRLGSASYEKGKFGY